MPKTIEIPTPVRIERLTRVMRVKGVDVSVHWSVLPIESGPWCLESRDPVYRIKLDAKDHAAPLVSSYQMAAFVD